MERQLLLIASLLPLLVGPFIAGYGLRSPFTRAFLDRFVVVALGGIILFHLWPVAITRAGWLAVISGLIGLMGPFLFHGILHDHEERASLAIIWIAFLGLAVHATLDGMALFGPDNHLEHADHLEHAGALKGEESIPLLALAVILHRFPMALAIWWLVSPVLGRRVAIGLLSGIAAATLLGYGIADRVMEGISGPGIAVFEAGVAGMLLHVVFGHGHGHSVRTRLRHRPAAVLGAIVGFTCFVAILAVHPPDYLHATDHGFEQLPPWLYAALGLYGAAALGITLYRSGPHPHSAPEAR